MDTSGAGASLMCERGSAEGGVSSSVGKTSGVHVEVEGIASSAAGVPITPGALLVPDYVWGLRGASSQTWEE